MSQIYKRMFVEINIFLSTPLFVCRLFLFIVIAYIFKEEFYKLKYCSTVVYMVPRA